MDPQLADATFRGSIIFRHIIYFGSMIKSRSIIKMDHIMATKFHEIRWISRVNQAFQETSIYNNLHPSGGNLQWNFPKTSTKADSEAREPRVLLGIFDHQALRLLRAKSTKRLGKSKENHGKTREHPRTQWRFLAGKINHEGLWRVNFANPRVFFPDCRSFLPTTNALGF